MLNGKDGKTVYIVDRKYRIVGYEQGLEEYFPELKRGEFCYRCFRQGEEPCQGCPMDEMEYEGNSVLYFKRMEEWMKVRAIPLELPAENRCFSVHIRELEKDKKTFVQEFPQLSIMEKAFEIDLLTGLYKRKSFLEWAKKCLLEKSDMDWCMVSIDVEHFKLFNEWYGQTTGDLLLKNIGMYLKRLEETLFAVAGYFGADDFLVLLPNDKEHIEQMYRTISDYLEVDGRNTGFLPVFGVVVVNNINDEISSMCNKAQVAAASLKGNYGQRICWFDGAMIEQMERKQKLLSNVRKGIERGEFVFFMQPKCDMRTGKIVSLEALVRWQHPQWGTVSAGEYIPLLEKSGLITELDMYIWDQVCQALSNWQKMGRRPVTISVNVSIVDIQTMDVPAYLQELTERYQIPPGILAVEITETAFAENSGMVSRVIERLHQMGFTILMDDFGSGYSSLNMLKDINVDVLKIDMKFIDLNKQNLKRGMDILESIIRLANMMELRVIAEGVEGEEQVDYLLSLGCEYGQGYYFYRPMPRPELEAIIEKEENVDFGGIRYFQMDHPKQKCIAAEDTDSNKLLRLWQRQSLKKALDESFVAGKREDSLDEMANLCELMPGAYHSCRNNEGYEFSYVSNRFLDLLGYTREELKEKFDNKILAMIHPQDRERLCQMTEEIAGSEEDVEVEYRMLGANGYIWVLDEVKCVSTDGEQFFVGVLIDITLTKERERTASLDMLTGVLNRNAMIPKIKEYLQGLRGSERRTAVFLMMDMDNLKEINDKLGHDYGDAALVHCIQQIRRAMGRDSIIGRMGGDEFVVLCRDISLPLLEHKLWVFRHEFTDKFTLYDRAAVAEISIGYALAPEDGVDFEGLYHKADVALREAKTSGKRTFRRYIKVMEQE